MTKVNIFFIFHLKVESRVLIVSNIFSDTKIFELRVCYINNNTSYRTL